jgi:hypothetical protein
VFTHLVAAAFGAVALVAAIDVAFGPGMIACEDSSDVVSHGP